MRRMLLMIETSGQANVFFSIVGTDPSKPNMFGNASSLPLEEDGVVSTLRKIGIYHTNEQAQRVADELAAERGLVLEEWAEAPRARNAPEDAEPDLETNAVVM